MVFIPLLFIVLAAADTCARREYDEAFLQFDWTMTPEDTSSFENLEDAVLLIIDIQKDFTYGSFGEPCFESTPSLRSLPANLGVMAKRFANRGGFIVASKDYHPNNHCSFYTTRQECLNSETQYPDFQIYQNSFPPHCMYNVTTGEVMNSTAGGFIGAALHEDLAHHMQDLWQSDQGLIVFKAFDSDWESFSAFQFIDRYTTSWNFTGGWGIPDSMMSLGSDEMLDEIYPSKTELDTHPAGWTSLSSILRQKNIKRIFVSGLVFDYCVKDTSIYSFENIVGENPWETPEGAYNYSKVQTFVITDLARPAADGGQNLNIAGGDFILGTSEKTISAAGDMLRAGVRFVSSGNIFCTTIPNCAECNDEDNIITCTSCRDELIVLADGTCGLVTSVESCESHWTRAIGLAIGLSLLSAVLSSCCTCYAIGYKKECPELSRRFLGQGGHGTQMA